MFVVAVCDLATPLEVEAAALAADLGTTAYEARMLLAPGPPAIVRSTPDKAAALGLLAKVRARGNGAVACDASAVVASGDMIAMRRFRLEADAIALDDRPDRLAYDDVLALLAAVHRRRSDAHTETKSKKFSATRTLMTGGFAMTRTEKKTTHAAHEDRESVLYVFRRGGATPWILRETGTSWAGLGRAPAPTQTENFRVAVAVLREKSQRASFDDRLVSRKAAPERTAVAAAGSASSRVVSTSSEAGVDLLAHLLALWVCRGKKA